MFEQELVSNFSPRKYMNKCFQIHWSLYANVLKNSKNLKQMYNSEPTHVV
jgi:hypothetical protein